MSNSYTIIPSSQRYKSAPSVDQSITIPLDSDRKVITEYDRSSIVDLATVYDTERQSSDKIRPTFKVNYIYENSYTGITNYEPFVNNLYYVNQIDSLVSSVWGGYPQYFEFDFFRPEIKDNHFKYVSKSGFNYNWMFYITYPYENDYEKKMSYFLNNSSYNWKSKDGIPFTLKLSTENGNNILSFECIADHGLLVGESVQLSVSYNISNIFEVYSLGNGLLESEKYIFNVIDIGYTGNTFYDGLTGTFKRVLNPQNLEETTSKYYVRKHKIITNGEDIIVTKVGYEKNPFNEEKKLELNSLTPNKITRISQKNSNNTYNVTLNNDIDLSQYIDNQNRPLTELFLTIINKGFSGYFNKPDATNVGLKEGWIFNITENSNFWWDSNNTDSNSNIQTSNYTLTDNKNNTKTFYYNTDLQIGDTVYGDFCEWNDYEQRERIISSFIQKIKYNSDNFNINNIPTTNQKGFYYKPHNPITIKVFSEVVETGSITNVDQVPRWSFYSQSDSEFRWRDLYEYGYIDENGRGVDYPFLNEAHYPFKDIFFNLSSEGSNVNNQLNGINVANKPKIDGCE